MQFIYVCGDSRSGGSGIPRLFEAYSKSFSVPFEYELFDFRRHGFLNDTLREPVALQTLQAFEKILKWAQRLLVSKSELIDRRIGFDMTVIAAGAERLRQSHGNLESAADAYAAIIDCLRLIHSHESALGASRTNFSDLDAVVVHNSRTFCCDLETMTKVISESIFIHTFRNPESTILSQISYDPMVVSSSKSKIGSRNLRELISLEQLRNGVMRYVSCVLIMLFNLERFGENKYRVVTSYHRPRKFFDLIESLNIGVENATADIENGIYRGEVWGRNSSGAEASLPYLRIKMSELLGDDEDCLEVIWTLVDELASPKRERFDFSMVRGQIEDLAVRLFCCFGVDPNIYSDKKALVAFYRNLVCQMRYKINILNDYEDCGECSHFKKYLGEQWSKTMI